MVAERVGFEPTWRLSPPIRFRVGAVMAASVPLLKEPDYMLGIETSTTPVELN